MANVGPTDKRRLAPIRPLRMRGQQRNSWDSLVAEQRRVKISVTVSASVLDAIDESAQTLGTSRSRLIDQVLAQWRARQRELALARQYATPLTDSQQEESEAWDAIFDATAADMLADADRQ